MHLLIYINSLAVGGAEHTAVKLATHWDASGHRVTLVTQTDVESDRFPVPTGVVRISTDTGGVSGSMWRAVRRNLRRFLRLRRVLRQERPDAIVTFLPTANVLGILASRGLGIPAIVTERAHPEELHLPPLQQVARDLCYARARAVVVQTEAGAQWYRRKLKLRNLVVIPNGISLPLPGRRPVVPVADVLPAQSKCVLFVGRLKNPKSPEAVVDAFVNAFRHDPEWHLVIIGDGDKKDLVKSRAQAGGVAARVHLPGSAGNVTDWYRRASIFVLASGSEGFPNALLEAMAHGVASIAWDCITGPGEIISDGENGFLLPVGEVAGLAERMLQLARDAALRERIANAGMQVLERYSDRKFLQRWDDVAGVEPA